MYLPHLDYNTYFAQVFWLLVSLSLLYFVVSYFILPRIRYVLRIRASKITGDLNRADSLNRMSQELAAEYDKKLQDMQKIASTSVDYIGSNIEKDSEALKMKLKQDMHLQLEETRAELDLLRKNLRENSAETISDFAKLYYELIFKKPATEELSRYVSKLLDKDVH